VFLPLCHVAERIGATTFRWALGSVMKFAESPETVPDNLPRGATHRVFGGAADLGKFYSGVTIALKDATPFQNWMYRHRCVGYRGDRLQVEGETPSLPLRLANRAAYWLVFRNISACWDWIAAGWRSPVRPRSRRPDPLVSRFRHRHGRGLRQTENCGVATVMPSNRVKLGSVGKAAPWGRGSHIAGRES